MNNICKSPFLGFVIGTQGDIFYCCMGIRDIYKISNINDIEDLEEFFKTSESLKSVREKFMNGEFEKISPCFECFEKEKKSIKTFKENINKRFSDNIDNISIKYLEFTTSNICNAVCATCNSTFSSSWKPYEKIFGRKEQPLQKLSNNSIEKIKKVLPKLELMIIKGGEPFADDNNISILENLFNVNKSCQVSIVTNMSVLKKKHIQVLNKNPNKINLTVSIDGTEKIYSWIRSTDFNKVTENMKKLYNETGLKFNITITLSIYNYFNIIDIFEYFSNQVYVNIIDFTNILHKPISSSIQSLPENLFDVQKKKICDVAILYDKVTSQSLDKLNNFLHKKENKEAVFDHIDKINQIRGFDLCDYVPELKAWRD
jgi:organic radical activating enzyme